MNKFSNQDKVQQLQRQISQQLDQQYNELLSNEKAKARPICGSTP